MQVVRVEQKAAMAFYEEKNDCTLVVKSDTAKHYTPKKGDDYWHNITILEVYNVIAP